MIDQRAFDAVDWTVQALHDREVPRRMQMRMLGVGSVAANILSNPSGYLVNAWILFVVLLILFLDERVGRMVDAKTHSAINVAQRTTFFAMSVRALIVGLTLGSVVGRPHLLNVLDEVLYVLFIYLMQSVVPHEPPAKRRLLVRLERATMGS